MEKINLKDSKGTDVKVGDIIATEEYLWLVAPIGTYIEELQCYGLGVFVEDTESIYRIDDSILKGEVIDSIYTADRENIKGFEHAFKYYDL